MAKTTTWAAGLTMYGVLLCLPFSADAQAPARETSATAPAALSSAGSPAPQPDRTTASYGDWILRCELAASNERSCEVAQTVQDQRGQLLTHVTVRRAAAGEWIISAQVGTNITVGEPLRILFDEQAALAFPFRRCLPRGCFAEVSLAKSEAVLLARRAETARLEYINAEGRPVMIPTSFRGLAAALDALQATE